MDTRPKAKRPVDTKAATPEEQRRHAEQEAREHALPASLMRPRRDIRTMFLPTGNEGYGDEEE